MVRALSTIIYIILYTIIYIILYIILYNLDFYIYYGILLFETKENHPRKKHTNTHTPRFFLAAMLSSAVHGMTLIYISFLPDFQRTKIKSAWARAQRRVDGSRAS